METNPSCPITDSTCYKRVKQEPVDEYSNKQEMGPLSENSQEQNDAVTVHGSETMLMSQFEVCEEPSQFDLKQESIDELDNWNETVTSHPSDNVNFKYLVMECSQSIKEEPIDKESEGQQKEISSNDIIDMKIKKEPNDDCPTDQGNKTSLPCTEHIGDCKTDTGTRKVGNKIDMSKKRRQKFSSNNIKKGSFDLFYCDLCGKGFKTHKYAKCHREEVHSDVKPHQCVICGKGFRKNYYLKLHMMTHTGNRRYKCKECGHGFIKRHRLEMHMEIHMEKKPHACHRCNKCFSLEQNLKSHIALVHSTNLSSHSCPICKKMYTYAATLKEHLLTHSDEGSFLCNKCGKAFKSKFSLNSHLLNIHAGIKPFCCKECKESFATSGTLKNHFKRSHGGKSYDGRHYRESEEHLCPECGSVLQTTLRGLLEHILAHGIERPYPCTVCGVNLKTTDDLQAHTCIEKPSKYTRKFRTKESSNVHTPESFQCTMCDKIFKEKSYLRNHMKRHNVNRTISDVRPHLCSLCGKKFKTKPHLAQHMSTHTNEKPFKCTVCAMAFKRKPNLDEHRRTHTGEKSPNQCTMCDKSFVRPCLLKKHMQKHK